MSGNEQRVRLVREARLGARVRHVNIVRIYDLGFTDRSTPYIVMELLDGHDLRADFERQKRRSPAAAVRLVLPVMAGLAHSHDRRVVHRDLKPENIFLHQSNGGPVIPKIVDFGIARCLTDLSETRITRLGSVFGTPHYLSPEQALGLDDVDHRADIWGLCAVLYECIAGQPPFGDYDAAGALRAVIQDDPPPLSRLVAGEAGLESIVMQGLRRDREQRWASVRGLAEALNRWLSSRDPEEDASAQRVSSWLCAGREGAEDARFARESETMPAAASHD
jgi:serine/threonine-protein kinase